MSENHATALQPSLLDRLTDDEPQRQAEPPSVQVLGRHGLRTAVLRDLAWLMNTTRLAASEPLEAWPEAERSVLNYGLPAFGGETASTLDIKGLVRAIREAILRFEPRILADTLEVEAVEQGNVLGWHNLVCVTISGQVWAQPVPFEMMLRTKLDLESGQVSLSELKV